MSPRKSRPQHNDPHLNRMPYEQGPRQGRFGRVENWREAEKRQAEQVKRHRQAHSRRAMQQNVGEQDASQSGKVQPVSGEEARQPSKPAQPQKTRRRPAEVNPWQQGRFGRVENWREEEVRRTRYQEAVEAARAKAAAEAQAKQAQRQQQQPHAQQQAQYQRRAQIPEQSDVKKETAQALRMAASHNANAAQASQPSARAAAEAEARRRQAARARQQAAAQRQQAIGTEQRAGRVASQDATGQSQPSPLGAHSVGAQHQQGAHSKQPVEQGHSIAVDEGQVPVAIADAVQQYSRSSYVQGLHGKAADSFADAQGNNGKYDRRPEVNYPERRQKSLAGKLPKIPMKIVGIVAAIFVVVLIVGFFAIGQGNGDAATSGANGANTAQQQHSLPTPIMSVSSGVEMHSAVAMEDLTEILIHNASYAYAGEITTQLAEAHNDDIIAAHGTGRVAADQPTGDNWMTGEFIRCFRSGNAGPVMSAIDCGGPVGATVYAPVTGEVVLVKEYKLYGEIDDFRIHIQPTGRPDLDLVLIHLTDVSVKQGDHVVAGVTPIAKIRDIFQFLDESVQLKAYTAESDNGNHTHIQMNNANHPEYTALDELKPQIMDADTPNAAVTP